MFLTVLCNKLMSLCALEKGMHRLHLLLLFVLGGNKSVVLRGASRAADSRIERRLHQLCLKTLYIEIA